MNSLTPIELPPLQQLPARPVTSLEIEQLRTKMMIRFISVYFGLTFAGITAGMLIAALGILPSSLLVLGWFPCIIFAALLAKRSGDRINEDNQREVDARRTPRLQVATEMIDDGEGNPGLDVYAYDGHEGVYAKRSFRFDDEEAALEYALELQHGIAEQREAFEIEQATVIERKQLAQESVDRIQSIIK